MDVTFQSWYLIKTLNDYVNRKDFYSIILQGFVDSNYLFKDVYVGWPEKVHDSRVFKNSPLYDACCTQRFLPMRSSKVITNIVEPPLVLGDSVYGGAVTPENSTI